MNKGVDFYMFLLKVQMFQLTTMTRKPKPPINKWCISMTGSCLQYEKNDMVFFLTTVPSPDGRSEEPFLDCLRFGSVLEFICTCTLKIKKSKLKKLYK